MKFLRLKEGLLTPAFSLRAGSQSAKGSSCRFVIPGLTRNPVFFGSSCNWMPDQVRHDGLNLLGCLNCGKVWQTGIHATLNWTPAYSRF